MLKYKILGSGSTGNAVLIYNHKHMVMLDAGLTVNKLEKRIRKAEMSEVDVQALFITHEHLDHAKGAYRFSKKYGRDVCATAGTHGKHDGVALGNSSMTEIFADFTVITTPVSHDAAAPVGYLVYDGESSIGYMVDLGTTTKQNFDVMKYADTMIMEFNHDADILMDSKYPQSLIDRIMCDGGHLSNHHAAHFISYLAREGRLKDVVMAHMSQSNNTPEKALETLNTVLKVPLGISIALPDGGINEI